MAATQCFLAAALSRPCIASAQSLQRPERALLHCALAPSHFCGHVLRIMAVEHTPHDECVNALEVSLVQFGEPSRVFLCGLDQQAFLIHYLYINAESRRKVTLMKKKSISKNRGGCLSRKSCA